MPCLAGWLASRRSEMHHQIDISAGQARHGPHARVVENLFRAHGAAYHTIHRIQPQARVGGVHHLSDFEPVRPCSPFDRVVVGQRKWVMNLSRLDATLNGTFLACLARAASANWRTQLDFIGLNYYDRAC